MRPEIIETNSVHSGDTQKAIAVIERDPHQTCVIEMGLFLGSSV